MISTVYLEVPLTEPSRTELDILGAEFEEVTRHISRANYIEAATAIEALFKSGLYDVRLIGYFLLGVFSERQLSALPIILECLVIVLRQSMEFMSPRERKERHLDSSLRWLFGKVIQHMEHYKRERDPRYAQWQQAEFKIVRQAAIERSLALETAIVDLLPGNKAQQTLLHVRTLLQGLALEESASEAFPVSALQTLRLKEEMLLQASSQDDTAVSSTHVEFDDSSSGSVDKGSTDNAEDSEQDADCDQGEPISSESASEANEKADAAPAVRELPAPSPEKAAPATAAVVCFSGQESDQLPIVPSPALRLFIRKLAAFESLCTQKHYRAAAIIGADLRSMTTAIDPRIFFPTLLAGYYKTLALHARALSQLLVDPDASQSVITSDVKLAQQALVDLYQVDLDAFLSVIAGQS